MVKPMPLALRELVGDQPRYTLVELVETRRQILRFARSVPIGPARNHHRQIAWSLRALFRDDAWRAAHVVKD
jgi:hypothetical protein